MKTALSRTALTSAFLQLKDDSDGGDDGDGGDGDDGVACRRLSGSSLVADDDGCCPHGWRRFVILLSLVGRRCVSV